MNDLPRLPSSVSSDGSELWDWAAKLGNHLARQDEIARLNHDIRKIGTRCGDCYLWMKSSMCPRERNVNGRNHGPSMNAAICIKFTETADAAQRRTELAQKVRVLRDGAS